MPKAGWFPDDDLPPRLPDDPPDEPPSVPWGTPPEERSQAIHLALAVVTHGLLRDRGLDHAFGGALALNLYADPRSTLDVDVNVFAPWDCRAAVISMFEAIGYRPEEPASDAPPVAGFRLIDPASPVLLDLFFALDDRYEHYEPIRERRVWFPFGPQGEELPFLSAEDIALFKLSFNRDKDWVDIRRMIQAGPALDADYIEEMLVALRGPSMFPRVTRLRAMVKAGGAELR
ncbi:MAG: hypothetical protein JWM89_1227 [Acidimicrobiales bacterium]|nr:hypothetical protein [Acidimicrobiales bacterium]